MSFRVRTLCSVVAAATAVDLLSASAVVS
eukprot:COSAG06_NODE_74122_length_147_cov_43.916667_1_plen_28_part_10